jgi:hypothetical protein
VQDPGCTMFSFRISCIEESFLIVTFKKEAKMDQKQTVKQMMDFNKRAFDNVFNTLSSLQDETESLVERFMEKSTFITPEGKKIFSQMADSYRKGRNDLKTMADENFRKASEYFVPADKKQ